MMHVGASTQGAWIGSVAKQAAAHEQILRQPPADPATNEPQRPVHEDVVRTANRELNFDTRGGEIRVQVVNSSTGAVVREVPSDRLLDASEIHGDITGARIDTTA